MNQMAILKVKITISEINSIYGFNSKMEKTEERIIEPEEHNRN